MFMTYAKKRKQWNRSSAAATAIMGVVTLAATMIAFLGFAGLAQAAPADSAAIMAHLLASPDISLQPVPFSREAALGILGAGLVAMSAGGIALTRSLADDLGKASRRLR